MKQMTSAEVRQAFLDFFEEMGHKPVASSSLVPGNDPTLLFTNAGMVQFKEVFLGMDTRPYKRATTAQKCMRVSGKHNDLDQVGYSSRHHTFFEMLGNFSFGDYFKADACRFAFDLLTKVYGLPLDRLYFTVHTSDNDAYNIWTKQIGVPADRVYRLGDKWNFWQMAETGPCGPTSEIHFDWEPTKPTDRDTIQWELEEGSGRILELWNLVFMQYNQKPDGTREPLPATGVDTGMGLERMVSVLQGVRVNYLNDLFTPVIGRILALQGKTQADYQVDPVPYNVIADHMRAAAFLIADGVNPGPKDRGSVCRMVIRRAARFGRKIGFTEPFLAEVAESVIGVMGGHYKELQERRESIRKAITQEEVRFGRTLERGLQQLDELLEKVPASGQLAGIDAFFLKSSLGLPFEVTRDVAQEKGYIVDEEGYKKAEEQHSLDSGGGQAMGTIDQNELYGTLMRRLFDIGALTGNGVTYDPYKGLERNARVLAIVRDGESVETAQVGDRVEVVLHATPFYVESGGQVSDTGVLRGEGWTIDVEDMAKPLSGLVVHIGEVVEGALQVGAVCLAKVDTERRLDIMRNHTATHLLHAQLRSVLGTHVQQKGSLVAPDRLRFDFSHDSQVTPDQMVAISAGINEAIIGNLPVVIVEKSQAEARDEGAMALFGEKYGEVVRTVTIENVPMPVAPNGFSPTNGGSHTPPNGTASKPSRFSYELCGGTHVQSTAVIGPFVITSEGSVAQGTRRIEALTGHGAQRYINGQLEQIRKTATQLGTTPDQLDTRLEMLQSEIAHVKQENARLRRVMARLEFETLFTKGEHINGTTVLVAQVSTTTPDTLREMTDWFRDKAKSGIVVFGMISGEKPQLIAAVTEDLTKKLQAGTLIKSIAPIMGGGGGGKANMAQAGGKNSDKLAEALQAARKLINEALAK